MTDDAIMILARALSRDGEVGKPVGIPQAVWDRHLLITGQTGAGKSTTANTAIQTAHPHTGGPTVVIDPKGDGWPREIARGHYAQHHSLDGVLLFEADEVLPAISFFDIRQEMESRPRLRCCQDVANHFLGIIDHLKPAGSAAIRSPDVIRYLIMALLDPVYGKDAFPVSDLAEAIYRFRRSRTVPDVQPAWSEQLLESLTDGNATTVDAIAQGAVTRLEKVFGDGSLRPMFEHSPSEPAEAFRFHDWIDQDVLILFDLSEMPDRVTRALANTLLSLFWRAIKADPTPATSPQRLLFIDEVPQLDIDAHLEALLALGRSDNLGVVPMMQFPGQLDSDGETGANETADADAGLRNNIHSYLLGRVPDDVDLAAALSSSQMSQAEVANRLGNLPDDRWLFQPAGPRSERPIQLHMAADPPLPPGHPEGPAPLSDSEGAAFEFALAACRDRTHEEHGIPYDDYTGPDEAFRPPGTDPAPHLSDETWTQLQATNFETLLPVIDTLPDGVRYDHERTTIECRACGSTHACSEQGLIDALRCHGDLDAIDREDVPPVTLGLSMSSDELEDAPLAPVQMLVLQFLYNVKAGRYDERVLDSLFDPLPKVFDSLGINRDHLSTLADAGYLTNDDQFGEFVYYDVIKDGRDLLNEGHRRGIDWGHDERDLTESLLHVVMVDALARYLRHTAVQDPDSAVETVIKYYELTAAQLEAFGLDGPVRLDVVGLDDTGQIRAVGEAERLNNDSAVAPIRDFDQIAAINPETALWAVSSNSSGQQAVIQPLQDPSDDVAGIDDATPRLPTTYSKNTRISDVSVDTDGLTQIKKLSDLRSELTPPSIAE